MEYNFHRSDPNRRSTVLAELSSLNHVQIVLRFLQYDIIKVPINNQPSPAINILRQVETNERTTRKYSINSFRLILIFSQFLNRQISMHLCTIFIFKLSFDISKKLMKHRYSHRIFHWLHFYKISLNIILMHPLDPERLYSKVMNPFSYSISIHSFAFPAIIHHHIDSNKRSADNFLFKYVLDHAKEYNIQIRKRNSVSSSLLSNVSSSNSIFRMNISTIAKWMIFIGWQRVSMLPHHLN